VFDPSDSFAIEKRGDVTALVPVAVRAFAYFVDEQSVAGRENQRHLLRLFLSGRFLLIRSLRVGTRAGKYENEEAVGQSAHGPKRPKEISRKGAKGAKAALIIFAYFAPLRETFY
jgi:hypothetical protein